MPKRQHTYDIKVDANNPVFREGEERVLRWLRDTIKPPSAVVDNRPARTGWDFEVIFATEEHGLHTVHGKFTLDVKVDQLAATTGRLAWEESVWFNMKEGETPTVRKGWGMYEDVDYYVFVLPSDTQHWHAFMVKADKLRETIFWARKHKPTALRDFAPPGKDRVTYGTAVDIALLRERGAITREFDV